MGKGKKLFSGSIGGFNKAQVVEYIEELNRKARVASEHAEFEIARLSAELSELEEKTADYDEIKASVATAQQEKALLEDDVANQRAVIADLRRINEELSAKLAELEPGYHEYKAKAEQYDEDRRNASGVLERAKAEAVRIVALAKAEADEALREATETAKKNADAILSDSERQVAENIRKVKYLYKRRDELLSAFEKVKDAAGGFYDSIASTLSQNSEE